jgi:hypothetical protein
MEVAMTSSGKKPAAREQLDRIEDALVEAILSASEAELREDVKARGGDPDKCLARIEDIILNAKEVCARRRFERAKSELKDWRQEQGKVVKLDRAAALARFESIRSRDPTLASKMMMAARNGEGLSEKDMEGLLEDIAKLEFLEDEDGGE